MLHTNQRATGHASRGKEEAIATSCNPPDAARLLVFELSTDRAGSVTSLEFLKSACRNDVTEQDVLNGLNNNRTLKDSTCYARMLFVPIWYNIANPEKKTGT